VDGFVKRLLLLLLAIGCGGQEAPQPPPAPLSPECEQAAQLWDDARCAAFHEPQVNNPYAAIYFDFLHRWNEGVTQYGDPRWGSEAVDQARLAKASHDLRELAVEVRVNVEITETLIAQRDALERFVETKRAGLARLDRDRACFAPEARLDQLFAEHRAEVEEEIRAVEKWLGGLAPLDPLSPDAAFALKHEWLDCSQGCTVHNAFWPYVGPYGSGRPALFDGNPGVPDSSDRHSPFLSLDSGISGAHPMGEIGGRSIPLPPAYERGCASSITSEPTDARVAAITMRWSSSWRSLCKGLSLPQAALFSRRVHQLTSVRRIKFLPWHEPYMAMTKTTRPS
jgi:hypothetical protein